MIVHPETEKASKVITASALIQTGGTVVSAISLDGGTAATGAVVTLDDSVAGDGTDKWALRAPQYGSASITFSKPIFFADGCYATLTGTASQASIAYV